MSQTWRTYRFVWMKADLCKEKQWGFKSIGNKIKSISIRQKKEDGASEKIDDETENQLHWKIKNKQTTTTTKNTKARTQSAEYNAYHVCNFASTNFQCLYFQRFNQFSKIIGKSSPIFFSFSFFLPTMHAWRCRHTTTTVIHVSVVLTSLLL